MIKLHKELARSIAHGHPWVWADAVAARGPEKAGELVDVCDAAGRFLARGIYDPGSPIAVRVLTTRREEAADARLVDRRVEQALALRRRLLPAGTDAMRLIHGEADLLPGVVCDRYADTLVLRFDAAAVQTAIGDPVVRALEARAPGIRRIVERAAEDGVDHVRGEPLEGEIEVHEGTVRILVDVRRSQKTGLYLDQRDNHLRIGPLCAGSTVLNLFSYTGGFGLHAAAAGALAVTNVDGAAPVIEAARRNFAANGIDPTTCENVVGDAIRWASAARTGKRSFDVVIVDPPSFAPSERTVRRALEAYRRLLGNAIGLVVPSGLLVAASCSSHVTEAAFLGTLAAAATDASRGIRVVEVRGAGPDHPTLPAFPEGRYLKVVIALVTA